MKEKITRLSWYDDKFYNKSRTHEEWFYEIWKRYQFNQDKIGLTHSMYNLPIKEKENHFLEFTFATEIENFLNYLDAAPPQPIRDLPVSDVFIMYYQLTKTDWYINNPNRETFERSISKIINEETLSREEQMAFLEMHKTPWSVFYENHLNVNWCAKKEMKYLSGIPISLDPAYSQKDTFNILKKKLNAQVGKLPRLQLQFDKWQENKILAVFDLRLWFKIQEIPITNIGIHRLIWPKGRISNITGDLVNPDDDINYSINLANRAINESSLSSLYLMCSARKFKNEAKPV